MFKNICGGVCGWCYRKYYERPDAFLHLFWSGEDIVTNLHNGIEFCHPCGTAVVAISCCYICYPEHFRDLRNPLTWARILKKAALFAAPIAFVQYVWRPFNHFLKFLVTELAPISSSHSDYLTFLSLACALFFATCCILIGRRYFTSGSESKRRLRRSSRSRRRVSRSKSRSRSRDRSANRSSVRFYKVTPSKSPESPKRLPDDRHFAVSEGTLPACLNVFKKPKHYRRTRSGAIYGHFKA